MRIFLSVLWLTVSLMSCGGESSQPGRASDDGPQPAVAKPAPPWDSVITPEFVLAHPPVWKAEKKAEGNLQLLVVPLGTQGGQVSLNLVRENLPQAQMALATYVDLSLQSLEKATEGFKLENSHDLTFGGRNYREVVFTFQSGGRHMRFLQRITVTSSQAWILTFGGLVSPERDFFTEFRGEAIKIVNSFVLR